MVKKEHQQYDSRSQTQVAPPPPYYTNGMENKGLEKSMDVIEDTLKNFNGQNGYISYNGLHHQPNGNGSKEQNDIISHIFIFTLLFPSALPLVLNKLNFMVIHAKMKRALEKIRGFCEGTE